MGQGSIRNYIGRLDRLSGEIADSNVDNLYLLTTLVNYIVINCFPEELFQKYDHYLQSLGFKSISEFPPTDDKRHRRLRRYENKDRIAYDGKPFRIEMFLHPKTFKFTGITTKIFYPTKALLDSLIRFYSPLILPKISFLELTLDMYTDEIDSFKEFIVHHLFMKYNRQSSKQFKNTFYTSCSVKSKGMRSYTKFTIPGCPVRLELMLKRRIIRRLGLELSSLDSQLCELDWKAFLDFRSFDHVKYLASLFQKEKKRIYQSKFFTLDNIFQIHKQHIVSGTDSLFFDPDNFYKPRPVSEVYHLLKKEVTQPGRFFFKLDDFNEMFFRILSDRAFL